MEYMWIIFYIFLVMYCDGQNRDAESWHTICGDHIDYEEFLNSRIDICHSMEHQLSQDKFILSLNALPIRPGCKCSLSLQSKVRMKINSPHCLTLDHDDCASDASGCSRQQNTFIRQNIDVVTDSILIDYSSCRKVPVAPTPRPPYCYSTFIEVESEEDGNIDITVSCGTDRDEDYEEFPDSRIDICHTMEHHMSQDKFILSLNALPIRPRCKCSLSLQSKLRMTINSPHCVTLDHDDCASDATGCSRQQNTSIRQIIDVVTDSITIDYSSCRKVPVAPTSRKPHCHSTFIEVESEEDGNIDITVSCGTDRNKDAANDDVKLGIGIGIGLGLALILALGVFVACYCKRKNKRSQQENPPGPNSTTNPSYNEAPDVIPHSLHREASGNYTYIEIDKVHKDPSSGAMPPPLPADRTASKYLKLHRMNSESVVIDNKAYEGFDNIASEKREGRKHINGENKSTSCSPKTHRLDSVTEIVDNKAYQGFKSIPSEKGRESKHIMSENKSTSSSPKIHRLDSETEVIDNKAYQGFESTPSEGQVGKNLVDAKNDNHHSHGSKTINNVSAADDDKPHPTFERNNHNMEGNSGYSLATANDKSVSTPPERQISDLDLEVVDNVAHPAVVERKTSA